LPILKIFNLTHLHWLLPLGVTRFEFCKDLWHHKTRVPGLSCGVVCMILCLADLICQYWHVMDRWMHHNNIYYATIALRGTQEALRMQRDRTMCHKYEISHLKSQ